MHDAHQYEKKGYEQPSYSSPKAVIGRDVYIGTLTHVGDGARFGLRVRYSSEGGKLLGTALVSVLLALTYFSGGVYAIFSSGHWEFLQPHLMVWFILFLICAVLMYGSIFIAIGAASSDMKDAQGMMQFAMLLVMMPIFITPVILRAPSSGLAVGASMFPTAAPFLMLVRLAMTPGPPLWQVLLGGHHARVRHASVWCAGRTFRVGS
jgi:ABC-2 type transport system permease protein